METFPRAGPCLAAGRLGPSGAVSGSPLEGRPACCRSLAAVTTSSPSSWPAEPASA